MKLQCPICQSRLEVERIDDGVIIIEVDENGECEEVANKSNGSTTVRCSKEHTHKIPMELSDKILEISLDHF